MHLRHLLPIFIGVALSAAGWRNRGRRRSTTWVTEKLAPIDTVFLFCDGVYIDAPYLIERRGTDTFVNGRGLVHSESAGGGMIVTGPAYSRGLEVLASTRPAEEKIRILDEERLFPVSRNWPGDRKFVENFQVTPAFLARIEKLKAAEAAAATQSVTPVGKQ